jgi:hypothetical protein
MFVPEVRSVKVEVQNAALLPKPKLMMHGGGSAGGGSESEGVAPLARSRTESKRPHTPARARLATLEPILVEAGDLVVIEITLGEGAYRTYMQNVE